MCCCCRLFVLFFLIASWLGTLDINNSFRQTLDFFDGSSGTFTNWELTLPFACDVTVAYVEQSKGNITFGCNGRKVYLFDAGTPSSIAAKYGIGTVGNAQSYLTLRVTYNGDDRFFIIGKEGKKFQVDLQVISGSAALQTGHIYVVQYVHDDSSIDRTVKFHVLNVDGGAKLQMIWDNLFINSTNHGQKYSPCNAFVTQEPFKPINTDFA